MSSAPTTKYQWKEVIALRRWSWVVGTILILQVGFRAVLRWPRHRGQVHPSYPVILLGLPQSGSLSVHRYLQCQGLQSRHFCCEGTAESFPCTESGGTSSGTCGKCFLEQLQNTQGMQPSLGGCGEGVHVLAAYDLTVNNNGWFLPQHFALPLLHQAYPNATWILNHRYHPATWAESIFHWHSQSSRMLHAFGLNTFSHSGTTLVPSKVSAQEVEASMDEALQSWVYNATDHQRKLTLLEQIYRNHTQTVRQWAQESPSHAYLELDVDEMDAGHRLSQFLRLKQKTSCQWTFSAKQLDEAWKDVSFKL